MGCVASQKGGEGSNRESQEEHACSMTMHDEQPPVWSASAGAARRPQRMWEENKCLRSRFCNCCISQRSVCFGNTASHDNINLYLQHSQTANKGILNGYGTLCCWETSTEKKICREHFFPV